MNGVINCARSELISMQSESNSRRSFLGASALAGVALPHVHAAENNTIQVALVGCGGRGTGRRSMRCR